jgi:hypothetical protein
MTNSNTLFIGKDAMVRMLHNQHALLDQFIAHLLARNVRIEQDLVGQRLAALSRPSELNRPVRCAR